RLAPSITPTGSPMDVSPVVQGGQVLHSSRTVAEAANGNFRVVWEDSGVFTRLFDSSGKALTAAVPVGATTSSDTQATVAMDAAGDAVVAWTHQYTDGSTQIEAKTFAPDGSATGWITYLSGYHSSQPSAAVVNGSYYQVAYTDNSSGSVVRVSTVD